MRLIGRTTPRVLSAAAVAGAVLVLAAAAVGAPLAWRQAIGGKILGKPASQAESVVVLCEDRSVRSFGKSGKPLWRFEAGIRLQNYLSRSPEGTNYFAGGDSFLFAVNRSGRQLWRVRLDAPLASAVVVGFDGRIFVPTDRSISCLSASGALKWRTALPAPLSCPAILGTDGGIVLGLANGTLIALDAFGSGSTIPLGSSPSSVGAGQSTGEAIAGLADGRILRVTSSDETPRLITTLGSAPIALTYRNGKLGTLLKEGLVVLVEPNEGRLEWTGNAVPSSAWNFIFDDRGLYALGDKGAAGFAIDGRRLWNLRIDGSSTAPILSDEGLLYSSGDDWILYAYRIEERVRADAGAWYAATAPGSYGLAIQDEDSLIKAYFAYDEATIIENLDRIAAAIAGPGIAAAEREATSRLMRIAAADIAVVRRKGGPPNVSPQYRERAVRLIGALGSNELIPFLVRVFRGDPETSVRAAAAEALGAIGSDPDGAAIAAFAAAITPPYAASDERLLFSVAASIGALCRFSGPPLSDQGIRLLTVLAGGDRPASVRSRARAEIASVSGK